MQNFVKHASAGAVLGGALLAAGGFGLAHAQPAQPGQAVVGDGLLNVTVSADGQQVGVLQDVSLTSAEALATSACADAEIAMSALQALDVSGTPVPDTCAGADGGVTFTFVQNSPGQSESAGTAPTPAPATTTAAPTTAR